MDMTLKVDLVVINGHANHSESGGHEWTMDMAILMNLVVMNGHDNRSESGGHEWTCQSQ